METLPRETDPAAGWNRRDFIRRVGLGAAAAAAPSARAENVRRPNIVVIIADDLGYADLGCYGSEIPTPHLDSLAQRGVRFTQFYGYTVCCPSRAALLTGLYPHQAGMGWYVTNGGDVRPPGPYQGYLNDRCLTIAELLKGAGYDTAMSGKWHLGESRPHWPVDRGFDHYFGLIGGGANYFDLDKVDWPGITRIMARDGERYHPPKEGFYMTDAVGDHAVEFLDRPRDPNSPFFLYTAFTAPHFPIQAPAADIARHRGRYRAGWESRRRQRHERMRALGLIGPDVPLSKAPPEFGTWAEADQDLQDLKMAIFAAQVEVMDRNVGRILAKIKQLGAEENTLVLFLSDHGGCAAEVCAKRAPELNRPPYLGGPESFAPYGRAWANVSNTPWRGFKGLLEEGGISIPLIVSWPGAGLAAGSLCHEVGHQVDVLPTLAEAAGVAYPEQFRGRELTPLAGRSLAPLFQDGRLGARAPLFWEFQGLRAVRADGWKLLGAEDQPWALYHLGTDRGEAQDLATQEPARVAALAGAYANWAKRCGVRPWREMAPHLHNL